MCGTEGDGEEDLQVSCLETISVFENGHGGHGNTRKSSEIGQILDYSRPFGAIFTHSSR